LRANRVHADVIIYWRYADFVYSRGSLGRSHAACATQEVNLFELTELVREWSKVLACAGKRLLRSCSPS